MLCLEVKRGLVMERVLQCTGEVVFNGQLYDNKIMKSIVENIKHKLISSGKLKGNSVVAVYLDRGVELLASVCALFEMNITFLLMNKEIPTSRLEYMLDKAKVDIVISSYEQECDFLDIEVINVGTIDNLIKHNYLGSVKFGYISNEISYVIFTSGSTGMPKAVQVRKSGLINFIQSVPKLTSIDSNTIIGCFTNSTFDIFILESIAALYSGARVVMGDDETCDNVKLLTQCIVNNKINTLQFTPSRLRMIHKIDPQFECLKQVKVLLIGGESFPEELLKDLQKNTTAKLFNMYGPTETTIWSTISELTNKKSVDIGVPIKDTDVYVVNMESLESDTLIFVEKESDEIGEICIAGKGLAAGYINDSEQTNRSFISKKINGKITRLYRTGDLGKYGNNGELLCLGRIDNQIKYNGHRIELEEIEAHINQIEGISGCAVGFSNKYNKICAFMIKSSEEFFLAEDGIKQLLLKTMPQYMCPSLCMFVNDLIYTSSGKIDRKCMVQKYAENEQCIQQNTVSHGDGIDIESQLIQLFATITGEKDVNLRTQLEGKINSIQYINLIVELEELFKMEFEDDKLSMLEFKTIGDIADYLRNFQK